MPDLFIAAARTYSAHIDADNAIGSIRSIEHTLRGLNKTGEDLSIARMRLKGGRASTSARRIQSKGGR